MSHGIGKERAAASGNPLACPRTNIPSPSAWPAPWCKPRQRATSPRPPPRSKRSPGVAIFRSMRRLKVETEAFVPLVGSTISRNLIAALFHDPALAERHRRQRRDMKPRPIKSRRRDRRRHHGQRHRRRQHSPRRPRAARWMCGREALTKGVAAITKSMEGRVDIGRMTQPDMLKALGILTTTQNLALMADCDLVIEAVVENEEVKKATYRELMKVLPADALVASNTSTISITRTGRGRSRSPRISRACTSSIRSTACNWSR